MKHSKKHHKEMRFQLGFVALLIFGGIFSAYLSGATGNFIGIGETTITADSNDVIYALLPLPESSFEIIAPDGTSIRIQKDPTLASLIVKVRLDGTVEYVRNTYTCDQFYSTDSIKVIGNLKGAAVSGTWTFRGPSSNWFPFRAEIKGKIYDDTHPSHEPLEKCPGGTQAGSVFKPVKIWNWHEQRATRFDGHDDVSLPPYTHIHAEEDPTKVHYVVKVPTSSTSIASLEEPKYFVDGNDVLYLKMFSRDPVIITAPNGQTLTVQPVVQCCLGSIAPTHIYWVKIGLDGTVHDARYSTSACESVEPNRIVTEGNLVGAPADGTWTIKNSFVGLVYPLRLEVQGKIFNDVISSQSITSCEGGAITASQFGTQIKFWNWHSQLSTVYTPQTLAVLDPEESPLNARFFNENVNPSKVVACGTTGGVQANLGQQVGVSAGYGIELTVGGTTYSSCRSSSVTGYSQFLDYGFEDGINPFTSNGNAIWNIDSDVSYTGALSARSGAIEDSELTNLMISVNTPFGGNVKFVRKTSTEKASVTSLGATGDHLRFYINGVKMGEWSGEKDWQEFSYSIPAGEHILKWSYEKDISRSEGQDAVWIDDIKIDLLQPTAQI